MGQSAVRVGTKMEAAAVDGVLVVVPVRNGEASKWSLCEASSCDTWS